MKYCVENDLSLFEFHDSILSFVSFDGRDLVVCAEHMNIHKDTPHNTYAYDMEITSAQITFSNLSSVTYKPVSVSETGADGQRVVFSGQEAMEHIVEELKYSLTVHHFKKQGNSGYSLCGCGIEPYFTIDFDANSVTVCWDEYIRKAWYERRRQYRHNVVLRTPKGDETVKLTIDCHEEVGSCGGSLDRPLSVNVGCTYGGREYWGHGRDYLWTDAFADLQKKLPQGVVLTCCLTCRHGNLCPVGSIINEVFCTKDVAVTKKSDLFFYTEDEGERAARTRQYCCLCEDYQPQADGFFTYSDYLPYLKKG
ncbi:MAG: hypothetical protein E7559_08550 [Ruminococcaceae bacterium]|nr:hypothetical protein [Oscillospiraceae bacterium]